MEPSPSRDSRPMDLAGHLRLHPAAACPAPGSRPAPGPGRNPARRTGSPPPVTAATSGTSAQQPPARPRRRNPPGPAPDGHRARESRISTACRREMRSMVGASFRCRRCCQWWPSAATARAAARARPGEVSAAGGGGRRSEVTVWMRGSAGGMFRSWMPGSSRWLSRATRARRKVAVCGEQHGGTAE